MSQLPPPIVERTEAELKHAFALATANGGDPHRVAFGLFPSPDDTPLAVRAARDWPTDIEVLAYQRQIQADPKTAGALPDKYQTAREILERARKAVDDMAYFRIMSLYCDVMSHIDKQSAGTPSVNVNIAPKVILMPAPMSKTDWSRQATEQQRGLVLEGNRIAAL